MRIPLVGGAYTPRSIIANCQRCINLYPENNGNNAAVQTLTHYQRPGLRPLVTGNAAPVRCIYHASNDSAYCCIGNTIYYITPSWQLQALGTINTNDSTQVYMQDNGATVAIVDGSPQGWLINMSNNAFSQWIDSTGLMRGADRIDYIDGFLIMNVAGEQGNEWISTTSNSTGFVLPDGTPSGYYAFKTAYPDPLVSLIVNHHYIILLGTLKAELWYNAGLSGFPFTLSPSVYYEHGLAAKYSLAASDISVYFLGQDLFGQGVVYRIGGGKIGNCDRISNHAIEYQIRKMANTTGISDAIGYCYNQDGHFFYVLHFPAGDQTWVYDDTLGASDPTIAWHQECWTDPDTGQLHRHRGNCHGFIYGQNVVGDHSNGTLYAMDLDTYADTVDGVVCSNTYIRTFPHIGIGETDVGMWGRHAIKADGRRIRYTAFVLDIECGLTDQLFQITLRYSDDRGRTYSSDILQSGGAPGEYLTQPIWRGLGIARDRVFEVEYATRGPATLNGAWIDASVLTS